MISNYINHLSNCLYILYIIYGLYARTKALSPKSSERNFPLKQPVGASYVIHAYIICMDLEIYYLKLFCLGRAIS